MSLTVSGTLDKNNPIIPIEERQTKGKLKMEWDSLPLGTRVILHFKNGIYIGVKREATGIKIFYTGRIVSTDSGETFFGTDSRNMERSITKYEMEK